MNDDELHLDKLNYYWIYDWNKHVDIYLIGDLDALEFFLGNVADPSVISSFCLALLEYVLARSRSGEVDLLLDDL